MATSHALADIFVGFIEAINVDTWGHPLTGKELSSVFSLSLQSGYRASKHTYYVFIFNCNKGARESLRINTLPRGYSKSNFY